MRPDIKKYECHICRQIILTIFHDLKFVYNGEVYPNVMI